MTPLEFGSAVDIIAQMDDTPVGRWLLLDLRLDPAVHVGKQVEPAVHVADRVKPRVLRSARVEKVDAGVRQCLRRLRDRTVMEV